MNNIHAGDTQVGALIATMPKVELHVHLEGCIEPEFALRLARKNKVDYPYATVDEARRGMQFSDLGSFISAMAVNTQTLRTVEDHYELAYAYLKRVHDENVVHVEMSMSPQGFRMRGLEVVVCIEAVAEAYRDAFAHFGMTGGIIAGIMRHRPPDEALEVLGALRACGDHVLAIGLHGAERGSDPRLFERHFQMARAEGWRTVAHAGEEGPADYIAAAVDVLKAERIDHGVRVEEDPTLTERLAAEQVPLTVCPVSNVYLGIVPTLADHNIARLLRKGLRVSLHSDDPAYFGGYLSDHFRQTAEALSLSPEDIAELNGNAIEAAFVNASTKRKWMDATETAYSETIELAHASGLVP